MIQDWIREAFVVLRLIRRPTMTMIVMKRHPGPKDLVPGVLVVVEGGGKQKWVCFQCPGGCGNRFQLSLNPSLRPRWLVESDWLGRPTIFPSIHQKDTCCAHFWVKTGEIEWCSDSGHQSAARRRDVLAKDS